MINGNLTNGSLVSNKNMINADMELNINYNDSAPTVSVGELYSKLELNKAEIIDSAHLLN